MLRWIRGRKKSRKPSTKQSSIKGGGKGGSLSSHKELLLYSESNEDTKKRIFERVGFCAGNLQGEICGRRKGEGFMTRRGLRTKTAFRWWDGLHC